MSESPARDSATAEHLSLLANDGAHARVYLDGAQVASWTPAGSTDDRLFVSRHARYGAGQSIRGGIPICFPQFGATGALQQHGFARNSVWRVVRETTDADGARAVLELTDTAYTRAMWPFAFHAELSVHVAGAALTVELTVSNTDSQPFAFTAALHPYFRVRDAYATHVEGLGGTRYRDALQGGEVFRETRDPVPVQGAVDRVYFDTPDVLALVEPHRTLRIEKRGFPDAVLWNPGREGTASRADFVAGDEYDMVCLEAGAVGRPVMLAPGARWTGTQIMTAVASAAGPPAPR
ncbi:D-hexose-6-phosphate mutarotase [Gemmatimonas sp.]|uniref:D-hexose-6-phosphate mutarotase n=1 Tax=Gemmatimonas sp. TaxID=1962908 RepID=UPI003342935A